jgi:hypothetical protein
MFLLQSSYLSKWQLHSSNSSGQKLLAFTLTLFLSLSVSNFPADPIGSVFQIYLLITTFTRFKLLSPLSGLCQQPTSDRNRWSCYPAWSIFSTQSPSDLLKTVNQVILLPCSSSHDVPSHWGEVRVLKMTHGAGSDTCLHPSPLWPHVGQLPSHMGSSLIGFLLCLEYAGHILLLALRTCSFLGLACSSQITAWLAPHS